MYLYMFVGFYIRSGVIDISIYVC